MTHPAPGKGYRLTRNFALCAQLVVVVAAVGLVYFNHSVSVSQLQHMADENNAGLTQVFTNSLWPRFRRFIDTAHTRSADELRDHPQTAALGSAVSRVMAETRVLKVKFYDLQGLTVFSTEADQIGSEYGENPRFVAALAGKSVALLEFREQFGAIDGPRQDVWVMSSYIPVRPAGQGGKIEGVAEIYSDVTDIHALLRQNEVTLIAVVGFGFVAVFLILVGIVWHAERQIRGYHQRSVELAANYARADAASKAKSTFLTNISHELRTPLNAIIGFSELIKDATYGPVGSRKYLEFAEDIHSSGRHLLEIINDVLDLVNADSGKMAVTYARIDATEIVREVVKLLASESERAEVELTTDIEAGTASIESDGTKIRQILLNLVANAIASTPPGGTVSVALHVNHKLGGVEFVVCDTGVGMSPEDIPKALAPFGQIQDALDCKQDGAGLGLPLSSKFAELLGGALELESEPGSGTRVSVVVPDHSANQSPSDRRSAA